VAQPFNLNELEMAGHSDQGLRDRNEDTFRINPELGLVIVADGVGGHAAGAVASALTCDVIEREIAAGAELVEAIHAANAEILRAVQDGRGKPGMGSTVVAVRLTEAIFQVAWVGDSRAYLWDGNLVRLTRDHSFVEAQLASGLISPEQARKHPQKNVILQAVGMQEHGRLDIGINSGHLASNSTLLLCSDGISDSLDDEQLSRLLSQRATPEEMCQRLVKTALACGGMDNATAVLIAAGGTAATIASRMWVLGVGVVVAAVVGWLLL
jgi:PPM family protein phosphatase